jgi:hypothetical protein
MNPHPRIRKAIKWGGLSFGLLSAFLLIALEDRIWSSKDGWWARLELFTISIGHIVPAPPEFDPNFAWGTGKHSKAMWWEYERPTPLFWFPLVWIPPACFSALPIAWWLEMREARRARVGRCPRCDYDRTGLAAGAVCPECAAAPPATS